MNTLVQKKLVLQVIVFTLASIFHPLGIIFIFLLSAFFSVWYNGLTLGL